MKIFLTFSTWSQTAVKFFPFFQAFQKVFSRSPSFPRFSCHIEINNLRSFEVAVLSAWINAISRRFLLAPRRALPRFTFIHSWKSVSIVLYVRIAEIQGKTLFTRLRMFVLVVKLWWIRWDEVDFKAQIACGIVESIPEKALLNAVYISFCC